MRCGIVNIGMSTYLPEKKREIGYRLGKPTYTALTAA